METSDKPVRARLSFAGVTPTASVTRSEGEKTVPLAFEAVPSLQAFFSSDAYLRLALSAGCRSTARTATGLSYFHKGPSGRLQGIRTVEESEEGTVDRVCLIDFKTLSLGVTTDGGTPNRDDDGLRFEIGRLHADDTASKRMKRKGFWTGAFDGARGDLSVPLSWGALIAYGWSGEEAIDLIEVEGAVMNGGGYGFTGDFYESLRLNATLNMEGWKPKISPYIGAFQTDPVCSLAEEGCTHQGPQTSLGLFVDLPFSSDSGLFGSTARRWSREEDATEYRDLLTTSYNLGLYYRKVGSWEGGVGLGRVFQRKGDETAKDFVYELSLGVYPWEPFLLKAGGLLIDGDTRFSTLFFGMEGDFK